MIVLYACEPRLGALVQPYCRRSRVLLTGDWQAVEKAAPVAVCIVVAAEWLTPERIGTRLQGWKQRFPFCPVVLVTRADLENARSLKDVLVAEVVWLEKARLELDAALRRVSRPDTFERLAAEIELAAHLPQRLARALAVACRADPPVRSVNELARLAGCHRGTLWREWISAVEDAAGFRLQDFLHLLLLVHARIRRSCRASWSEVTEEIGVSEWTLRRLARSVPQCSLADLAADARHAGMDELLRRDTTL